MSGALNLVIRSAGAPGGHAPQKALQQLGQVALSLLPAGTTLLARQGFQKRTEAWNVGPGKGGGLLPLSRQPYAKTAMSSSRSMIRIQGKRLKSRSRVRRWLTPCSRQTAAIWASKATVPTARPTRTASARRPG